MNKTYCLQIKIAVNKFRSPVFPSSQWWLAQLDQWLSLPHGHRFSNLHLSWNTGVLKIWLIKLRTNGRMASPRKKRNWKQHMHCQPTLCFTWISMNYWVTFPCWKSTNHITLFCWAVWPSIQPEQYEQLLERVNFFQVSNINITN